MSKRVANCKGRSTAHFGRVRLGWRKQRMLDVLTKQQGQLNLQEMTDEVKETLRNIKRAFKKILPKKRELRRHQGR